MVRNGIAEYREELQLSKQKSFREILVVYVINSRAFKKKVN